MRTGTKEWKLLYKIKLYKSKEKTYIIILFPKAKCLNHTFCLNQTLSKVGRNNEFLCVKYTYKIQTYLKFINLLQTICIKTPAMLLTSCVALGLSLNTSGSQFPHLEGKIQYLIAFFYGLKADWHIVSIQ